MVPYDREGAAAPEALEGDSGEGGGGVRDSASVADADELCWSVACAVTSRRISSAALSLQFECPLRNVMSHDAGNSQPQCVNITIKLDAPVVPVERAPATRRPIMN